MSEWGGKRKGSGRKPSELGKTVVMRVPESRVEEIKQLIHSANNFSDDCVNSQQEALEAVIDKWETLITPDRQKQPRWENAARLLNELKTALSIK